ncbi:hypothetical protein GGR57DRAFT_317357 [Xylariaceae sp. FL1272]|nr:hypothetical protein GGR57DRAFT_317357 [Xylariaceae sp. FL1272]KAI1268093.1 hypothetical protein F5Y18DRAFT_424414 [Xylariaceae sp. FL1019]
MPSKEPVYEPVERLSGDTENEGLLRHYTATARTQRWSNIGWILCLVAIVVTNGFWMSIYSSQQSQKKNYDPNNLAAHEFSVLEPYEFSTPYSEGNISVQNALWSELFPVGGGAVKVDKQWAIDSNLKTTQGYAPDGKAIYVVGMYHHLHCLTVIRTSLYLYHYGLEQVDPWAHIPHCIDALRQAIQCLADPTLGGIGTTHQCRDFRALKEWTFQNAYTEYIDNPIDTINQTST